MYGKREGRILPAATLLPELEVFFAATYLFFLSLSRLLPFFSFLSSFFSLFSPFSSLVRRFPSLSFPSNSFPTQVSKPARAEEEEAPASDAKMRRVLMDNYQEVSEHDCGDECHRC